MTAPDRLRELALATQGIAYDGKIPSLSQIKFDAAVAKFQDACDPQTILALLNELAALKHDIARHVGIASREAEARLAAEKERDEAYERAATECDEVASSFARRLDDGAFNDKWKGARKCAEAIRALARTAGTRQEKP